MSKNIYFCTASLPKVINKWTKNNCRIDNQVIYPFFISNEFIDFFEFFRKINVSLRILDVFVIFHITQNNFPSNRTNSSAIIAFFFSIFKNVKNF